MSRHLFIPALLAATLLVSCSPWTPRERKIISQSDSVMYVTVMPEDSVILRAQSIDFPPAALASPEFRRLVDLMYRTVTDPSQDGVGIAAPQVGINRRLVWVQRFDKPGEPFEWYANIRIDSLLGPVVRGPEGCLSVPPMRGIVPRSSSVVISYASGRERVSERVEGYTAIIFQHECDHLDGILYIDRADSVFVSESWQAEREGVEYPRPEWW